MSLTKKEHTRIDGEYVKYSTERSGSRCVDIDVKTELRYESISCSLPEARAIHAELTELFKLLDEKV